MDAKTLKKMRNYESSKSNNPNNLRIAANEDMVQGFLHSDVDKNSMLEVEKAGNVLSDIESRYNNDELNGKTPEELLSDIKGQFKKAQVDALLNDCKNTVLDSLIGPFGLSHAMIQDKRGGNVTTIHNAQNGIYADKKDEYDRSKYKYGNSLNDYKNKKTDSNGKVVDEYSGDVIDANDADVDHVNPLKKFHQDGGFMLDDEGRSNFAKDEGNYAITDKSTNRSKGGDELNTFENSTAKDQDENNKKRFGIDNRRANAKQNKADETEKKHLPNACQKAAYYAKNSAITGAKVGVKYGFQQAIGLMLREITIGIFDEIKDIYRNGILKDTKSIFEELKIRVVRIVDKVKAKWKEYLIAFKDGAISAFLSNFATTLINIFATTEKEFVRMIREGAMSLYKACKVLFYHPEMTMPQAAHEATKLIVTGLGVTTGILMEQVLQDFLMQGPLGAFAPLAQAIASVVSSLASGIFTLIAIYAIDKIDLFNVKAQEKQQFISDAIAEKQNSVRAETQEYIDIIEKE